MFESVKLLVKELINKSMIEDRKIFGHFKGTGLYGSIISDLFT